MISFEPATATPLEPSTDRRNSMKTEHKLENYEMSIQAVKTAN